MRTSGGHALRYSHFVARSVLPDAFKDFRVYLDSKRACRSSTEAVTSIGPEFKVLAS